MPKFQRVLIANRGEIAVRIIRCLRQMGIESVAIYAPDDRHSYHVKLADFAIPLPERSPLSPYLDISLICEAIEASAADGVHPGYGFLSENPEFTQAVAAAGAVYIGASAEAIRLMGDKVAAKKLVAAQQVPTVPGEVSHLLSLEQVEATSRKIGFPLMVKAAAGGGGRGMRVVHTAAELASAFESCRREAQAYFGNPAVFCERYIQNPRHIEIQILRDQHGNGVHLFERDCSVQRRHQKLLEEAPSFYLNPEQRAELGRRALQIAKAVDYCGAGTVEFICESPDQAYFMEMNTRIQVEHPATEMITGVDLIAAQIRIAQGEPLGFQQSDLHIHGFAIEARINAEDPSQGFLPTSGTVKSLQLPSGPFVRTDTHLYAGYALPTRYDSMLAKVIAWGPTRAEAIACLLRSLQEVQIEGVKTNVRFQERLLQHPAFQAGEFTTKFLETEHAYFAEKESTSTDQAPWGALGLYCSHHL